MKKLSMSEMNVLSNEISKKVNEKEDNEMQIAQVQFIKFLDTGKTCVIKNSKSYIYVTNYSKSDAKVQTDPEDFKYSLLKCWRVKTIFLKVGAYVY